MRTHTLRALVFALVLPAGSVLAAPSAQGDREIRHLVDFVAASGCTFIRNGDPHDAKSAAEHLAMKYGKARSRLASPEDFIERVASSSYLTGREYRVQCPGQAETSSASWLQGELRAWRRATALQAAVSRP